VRRGKRALFDEEAEDDGKAATKKRTWSKCQHNRQRSKCKPCRRFEEEEY
jgi:hypothetical protein